MPAKRRPSSAADISASKRPKSASKSSPSTSTAAVSRAVGHHVVAAAPPVGSASRYPGSPSPMAPGWSNSSNSNRKSSSKSHENGQGSSIGKRSSRSVLRPGASPPASIHRRALPSPPVHPSNSLPSAGGSSKLLLGVALVACLVASLFGSSGGALRRYAPAQSSRFFSFLGLNRLYDGSYGGWGQPKCGTVAVEPQLSTRLHAALNLLRAELGGPNYQPYAYDAMVKFEHPRLVSHFDAARDPYAQGTRAVTLHFAGAGNLPHKHAVAQAVAAAVFMEGAAASSILDIVCTAATSVDQLKVDIASQLLKCPTSVIVLHDIEQLSHPSEAPVWGADDRHSRSGTRFGSAGGLIALERFFEDATVEVPEVGMVDLRRAVFILTSTVGAAALKRQGISNLSPYSALPTSSSASASSSSAVKSDPNSKGVAGTGAVIEVIRTETRAWASARPALGGRLSNSQVPFV